VKVLRYGSSNFKTNLARQIPPGTAITVMHLGRGGVTEEGTLDSYNKDRVFQTLEVASLVNKLRPRAKLQVIWTGGCNRQEDRADTKRPASEAGAANQHALTMIEEDETYTMVTEEDSTSTVENATRSAELVADSGVIVIVTDPLHYLARKVQFIMKLVFPQHRLVFVEVVESPPGTDWKSKVKHLISTLVTVVGMAGVTRGDAAGIQRRQNLLQRLTGH
jgi:hypothetical protein